MVFGSSLTQRVILAGGCFMIGAAFALADDAPLFQQEPYDTIRLDDANRGVELKARPLDLPDHRLPAKPNPSDELEIHLLDRPRKTYKLAWESIVEVKLFEQRVLDEAERLVETKKLDEAYHYYDFLERRYPKMAGLGPSYNKFLMAGAREAFKQEKYDECLALTGELFVRDPEFPGAATAILRAAEKLIDRRFSEKNFTAARRLMQETADRLKERAEPLATTWNGKLRDQAVALMTDSKQQARSKHYIEASREMRQALAAWPDVEGGQELAATIQAQYPEVVVGVTALSAPDAPPADSWEARRDARLLGRPTVDVARSGSDAPSGNEAPPPRGPYRLDTADAKEIRFVAVEESVSARPKQPKQIVERLFPDTTSALQALRRGEIKVVDRIGPWDAAALSSSDQLVVEPYRTASLHLLVPNLRRPPMSNPTFRRAFAHAVDRSGILTDQLSRTKSPPGCEVLDGLFKNIAPDKTGIVNDAAELRYDAAAAKLLAGLAAGDLIAGARANGVKPSLPTGDLVLAYPADETTRLACRAIALQARAAGIPLGLHEITAAELTAGPTDADLFYVPWTPLEPLTELPRLIGRQGLGGDAGPLLERVMQEALSARPNQASERVGRLDQMIREETLVIPLWRLNNFIAYDRTLTGVGKHPVTLYQNIEQWQLTAPNGSER
jgi:hypothetical protein